jgi:hypothetical protein
VPLFNTKKLQQASRMVSTRSARSRNMFRIAQLVSAMLDACGFLRTDWLWKNRRANPHDSPGSGNKKAVGEEADRNRSGSDGECIWPAA